MDLNDFVAEMHAGCHEGESIAITPDFPSIRQDHWVKTRGSVLDCAGPPALSNVVQPAKSSRGLEH